MAESDAIRERVARHVCAMVIGKERVDAVMDDVVTPLLQRIERLEAEYESLEETCHAVSDGKQNLAERLEATVAELKRTDRVYAVASELARNRGEQRDTARAALAEIRDRHRRHGDRCSSCEQKSRLSANSCDACGFGSKHPCETRRIAERGLGESEET